MEKEFETVLNKLSVAIVEGHKRDKEQEIEFKLSLQNLTRYNNLFKKIENEETLETLRIWANDLEIENCNTLYKFQLIDKIVIINMQYEKDTEER